MEGLPSRLREEVLDGRDLSTMSADDVVAIEENAQGWWRSWLARRIGGGGSGTSPGGGDGPDARAIQLEEAVRAGLAPDIEAAERLRMSLPENRGDGGFASMGRLILGSTNEANVGGVDAHEPVPNIRTTVPMNPAGMRAFQNDWRTTAHGMAAFGAVERIAASHSRAERVVSPEMARELAPHLMRMRGMAAAVQGTGVINPSEMEAINAAIPDPTSMANIIGMPWDTLEANLREWRTRVLEDMRINLESVGADEDSIRYAERYMRRAGTADARSRASAPDSGGEAAVRIRLPDGSIRPITRASYDALRAAGHSPELVP